MTTENYESKVLDEKLAKITVSVGKPDKQGKRNVGVEYTVSMKPNDTEQDYEKRFEWVKTLAMREL